MRDTTTGTPTQRGTAPPSVEIKQEPVSPDPVVPIINLPKLVLHKRTEVEKVVGKPTRIKSDPVDGDIATYSWGTLAYHHGRLDFVSVKFPAGQPSYQQAFQLLNLSSPPAPYVAADGAMIWQETVPSALKTVTPHPIHNAYTCCGHLALDGVLIYGNGSGMAVYILDLDAPSTWTVQEADMYFFQTGLPVPDEAVRALLIQKFCSTGDEDVLGLSPKDCKSH